jgi:X-Pro dipeptidyl-peptidase
MKNGMDRITGDYNDFWAGRDYLNDMKPMKAALLMSHGFNDWNVMPEHSYRIYKKASEMGLPTQIFYHQNGHGGPPPFSMMNRWFTRYLFGIKNDVEKDPKAWIVREDDKMSQPTAYPDYPNPAATPVTLYLQKGNPKAGKLLLRKTSKQGTESLTDDSSFDGASLAKSENSKNRLLYVSEVLQENVHISGLASITLKLACSKPAANLSVWLVSLPWNEDRKVKITDNIITRGWADPQNYKSLTQSEPLVPGKFYTIKFDLQPDDQIIKKGQQIGLMIFSTDKEFTLQPQPGTQLTIDIESSKLILPIVGGVKSFSEAVIIPAIYFQ